MAGALSRQQATQGFFNPAVLGATYLGGQVAALFASAGIRVRLYDKPCADNPNALALQAIDELLWQKPLPFSGQEASSLIDASNYRDDWTLLKDHDIIVECDDGDLNSKSGLLTRLAPGLSKEAALVSLADGLPLEMLSRALPAGLRPRFLGAHFYRPSRFMRLVELFPALRTETRVYKQVSAFFTHVLGREVIDINDSPNYLGNRLLVFLTNASFYHAQALGLSLDDLEFLTTFPQQAENKGVVSRIRFLGQTRLETLYARTPAQDKALFPLLREKPSLLVDCFSSDYRSNQGQHALNPMLSAPSRRSLVQLELPLRAAVSNYQWQALRESDSVEGQFVYRLWRDVWQYMMTLSAETGASGEIFDKALRHGIGWPYGFYDLLQSFDPKIVLEQTKLDKAAGHIDYPISEHWGRRRRAKQATPSVVYNPFADTATLVRQSAISKSWWFDKKMIIWQPLKADVAFNQAELQDLCATVDLARSKQSSLMIYHHGNTFGKDKDWLHDFQHHHADLMAEQIALKKLVLNLRMLPSSVLLSISGKLCDAGCAVMMQADRVICDVDVGWQLSAIGQGLTAVGGVWFEWLRRMPVVDDFMRLAQIHSVLKRMVTGGAFGDVHTARQVGILRMGDEFTLTKAALIEKTHALAQASISGGGTRNIRYGQNGLNAREHSFLAERASNTANAAHYLALLNILHKQVAGRTISLRLLLEHENELFNTLCEQQLEQ